MIGRRVAFSPEARADLIALYDWIAEAASPEIAFSYIERLEAYLDGFDVASERGTRRDDVALAFASSGSNGASRSHSRSMAPTL